MNALRRTRWLVTVYCSTMVIAGCASNAPPPMSGFLGSYDAFAADPRDPSLLWWERENFDWTRYKGVILEPITVFYHPESVGSEIRPEELLKLTEVFREAVVEAFGDDYSVTDLPGGDVLRVRCAITDVIPVRPALNALTSTFAMVAVDVGGAAIEVEFLDSVTGERLAAGVDQKLGSPVGGVSGLTRLGAARAAFRDWALELRAALETNP
jgi:Protein of unknown function (DUF3313)